MGQEFINITSENITDQHLCCIIRTRTKHPGVEAKRQWLADRIKEGHVFRKLDAKGCCFIEYAPLEKAWVPIEGDNFYYIYCLWTAGEYRGKGYGRKLLEYCIEDAKKNNKSGICVLGAKNQKNWLTSQSFMGKNGFEIVDETDSGYQLLSLSFDGTKPRFTAKARSCRIEDERLTIYYDMQCPFIYGKIEDIKKYGEEHNLPINLVQVNSLEQAKNLPCVFNNWAAFCNGKFVSVNLLDIKTLEKLIQK